MLFNIFKTDTNLENRYKLDLDLIDFGFKIDLCLIRFNIAKYIIRSNKKNDYKSDILKAKDYSSRADLFIEDYNEIQLAMIHKFVNQFTQSSKHFIMVILTGNSKEIERCINEFDRINKDAIINSNQAIN
jgi:hypothetical protein